MKKLRNMKKKYVSMVLAACMLSGVLNGCSQPADSSSGKSTSEDSVETTVTEPTTTEPETTEPEPTQAEEPDISAILTAYQQYADGLTDVGEKSFSMAYINDDNVPECVIWTPFGVRVLSYTDETIRVFTSDGGDYQVFAYTPRSGEFAVSVMPGVRSQWYYSVELNDTFEEKMSAESEGMYDEVSQSQVTYCTIDGNSVDGEVYNAQTDMSHFEYQVKYWEGRGIYDSILSAYAALTAPEQSPSTENSEFILPESNTRYMTYNDLQGLDTDTLRIAKNEIYARHGRTFQSEDLSQYFNSKSWYRGTVSPDDFRESVFNDYEKANVSLIAAFQDGISDGEYYGYDFMFSRFELSDGILTAIADPTTWSGGMEGFALSLPFSDSCRWWDVNGSFAVTGGYSTVKGYIDNDRAEYLRSPSTFGSPVGIYIVVQNGTIVEVKVYIS